MVVGEQTLYAAVAVVALIATTVAVVRVRKFEGSTYRHMLIAPVALGLLTLGYTGMALDMFVTTTPEGEPVYFTRFGLYTLTYAFLMAYIAMVGGGRFRDRMIPAGAALGFTYGTVIVQLSEPPLDTVGSLIVITSLIAVIWVFFGPLTSAAAAVTGKRRLLFAKLRNLAVLVFLSYMLLALITRQALGLLDGFTGVFVVAYVDLLAHIGIAGLILYSQEAIEELTAENPSPFETFTDREAGPSEKVSDS